MSLNFLQPGLDAYRRPKLLAHRRSYSDQIQQLGPSTPPRTRDQFCDLDHDDGLFEYPDDIFGTATLAPIETALAKVERLGKKRAEKIAGLRIEEEKAKAKFLAERKEALAWLRLANEHMKPQSLRTTICEGRNMGKRSLRRRENEIIHPEMFKKYYKNSRRLMRLDDRESTIQHDNAQLPTGCTAWEKGIERAKSPPTAA
ncbi:hypothetical protein M405DRAFT_880381 [Rhizopogon salebrosus TDB-379]|nr:hypothetical protein M405DRAFT_880381 [Rhizopogon salebrosus TDB-379]